MILFFGDSLISAENNNFNGIVEKLNIKDSINLGISGTCIGNYSIYPVKDNNLIQLLYKNEDKIKQADKIFLEYGSNDISSICCGYSNLQTVLIELNKCIDFIKQTNSKIEIYFILLGKNIEIFSEGQCSYLKNDYLKSFNNLLFPLLKEMKLNWISNYKKFEFYVKQMDINIIELPLLSLKDIDSDNMHPSNIGYTKIAKYLKDKINFEK